MIELLTARSLRRWAICWVKSSGAIIKDSRWYGGETSTIERHILHLNGIQLSAEGQYPSASYIDSLLRWLHFGWGQMNVT